MSDDVHLEEEPTAAEPENPKVVDAMRLMEEAMRSLKPEEMKALRALKDEVEQACEAPGSEVADKRLEFCYTIKFSPDRITNPKLRHAAEAYINAIEG